MSVCKDLSIAVNTTVFGLLDIEQSVNHSNEKIFHSNDPVLKLNTFSFYLDRTEQASSVFVVFWEDLFWGGGVCGGGGGNAG